jgi:small basic protein (TIGR04137 family)
VLKVTCLKSGGTVESDRGARGFFALFSGRFAFIVPPLSSAPAARSRHSSFHLYSIMSQHRSLKGASTIAAKRNVLKRFERVELLKKRGQFKAGDKVIGLRKTKPEA